jgi:hypothetical protein
MTLAEVKLWGRTIGAVSLEDRGRFAAFQYDPAFDSRFQTNIPALLFGIRNPESDINPIPNAVFRAIA